jgi:hypothetical protein
MDAEGASDRHPRPPIQPSRTTDQGDLDRAIQRWLYDRGGRDTLQATRLGAGAGWAAGEIVRRHRYKTSGPDSLVSVANAGTVTNPTKVWYDFGVVAQASYTLADLLQGVKTTEEGSGTVQYAYTYSADGTYRLTQSQKYLLQSPSPGTPIVNGYTYDVSGNRVRETFSTPFSTASGVSREGV